MAITQPKINIVFEQAAKTLLARSERGIAVLIVRDDTVKSLGLTQYADLAAAQQDKTKYTAENYQAICDLMGFMPYKAYVYRMDTDGTLGTELETIAQTVKTGWITVAGMDASDAAALAAWVKARESKRTYKAIVHNLNPNPDSMHVVNFGTETLTFADSRGETGGAAFLPSLLGILATCNVESSATSYICTGLTHAAEPTDPDAAAAAGKLILLNNEDGAVELGTAVNSLTSYNNLTRTEDMSYIDTVEAMDLIRDDVSRVFRTQYRSKRNTRDEQMNFIATLNNSYFKALMRENILNPDADNAAAIDVSAQRAAWVESGKAEAADWDDDKVRATPFRHTVFLCATLHILGGMIHLNFVVDMV